MSNSIMDLTESEAHKKIKKLKELDVTKTNQIKKARGNRNEAKIVKMKINMKKEKFEIKIETEHKIEALKKLIRNKQKK